MRIKLQEFKFESIPRDGRIFMIIGRRGTGKSTLIRDLMYNMRERFQYAVGMSPTQSSVDMLQQHIPHAMVYEQGFSEEKFAQLLKVAAAISRKGKPRSGLLVLDDCNADKGAFRGKVMRDAFYNGRHYGVNIFWAMHYCLDLLPDLRGQIDYVFLLKENVRRNKERLYANFFGMFEKYEDFSKVMDNCTTNHECLVLDNTAPNHDPEKCLYHYKAKRDLPPFRLGKEIFYKLSNRFKKTESTSGDDDLLRVHIRPGPDGKVVCADAENPRVECVEKL